MSLPIIILHRTGTAAIVLQITEGVYRDKNYGTKLCQINLSLGLFKKQQ